MEHRTTRPSVVTAAVMLWWVVAVASVVGGVIGEIRMADDMRMVGLVAVVLTLAWWWFVVYGSRRLAAGSGTARFWLAVLAAVAGIGDAVGVVVDPLTPWALTPLAMVVAAVLTYLPSARPFFPKTIRTARRQDRPIVGWDPNTGEPIRASE
ncbi:MAG: hypothetical protein INR72_16680 [Williamsia herbipolensis]|nr:hypothetical protein [Williamsia herbipolensis]